MTVEELEAGIEAVVVPLGFSGSQNLLFCAATRDLVEPYPWVRAFDEHNSLDHACTDLMVTEEGGRITEVSLEFNELGDLLEEQVGPGAAGRYRQAVPGSVADAGPVLLDSLRALFAR